MASTTSHFIVRYFNPRSSCEERHLPTPSSSTDAGKHFNPRSSCEERHVHADALEHFLAISIHAPHARSDTYRANFPELRVVISIHAPHARSDTNSVRILLITPIFQSTLLMRGATRQAAVLSTARCDFNPRSSCEERHLHIRNTREIKFLFQSTLLMRGATRAQHKSYGQLQAISIHAPHARSDTRLLNRRVGRWRISIHAPHARSDTLTLNRAWRGDLFQSTLLMRGATCSQVCLQEKHLQFQSTLLMRGATRGRSQDSCRLQTFQSTLLMRGATLHRGHVLFPRQYFNPRSSCEERHEREISMLPYDKISIHAPHARSDTTFVALSGTFISISIHAPHARSDTVSILGIDLPDFIIYFSRTYPFSPKMPTSRHLSCKLHFLCDGTSHFGDL